MYSNLSITELGIENDKLYFIVEGTKHNAELSSTFTDCEIHSITSYILSCKFVDCFIPVCGFYFENCTFTDCIFGHNASISLFFIDCTFICKNSDSIRITNCRFADCSFRGNCISISNSYIRDSYITVDTFTFYKVEANRCSVEGNLAAIRISSLRHCFLESKKLEIVDTTLDRCYRKSNKLYFFRDNDVYAFTDGTKISIGCKIFNLSLVRRYINDEKRINNLADKLRIKRIEVYVKAVKFLLDKIDSK